MKYSIDVTINVTDVDEPNFAPVFTEGTSTTRSVAENPASGQNIGAAVTATDANMSDTLTYTLGGTDAADFGIVPSSGQLQTSAALVFFAEDKRDFQIAGKDRGSTGKGLRAITHAAVKIGLMEFCRERNLPHPGFVVLDSPLLAYWKPEGDDDDLRGTDLKEMFYRYLLGLRKDSQIIIAENEHPPDFVSGEGNVIVFTKNPHQGRYGFSPSQASTVSDKLRA